MTWNSKLYFYLPSSESLLIWGNFLTIADNLQRNGQPLFKHANLLDFLSGGARVGSYFR